MSEKRYFDAVVDLEKAVAEGIEFTVSPNSPREVLIRAAELDLSLGYFPDQCLGFYSDGEWEMETSSLGMLHFTASGRVKTSGYLHVSESMDYDLIEAWLRAGHALDMDASAAVQKDREDIVELMAGYGVAANMKILVDGSHYIDKKGVVRIPEGFAMIRPEALTRALCMDREVTGIQLPQSMEIVCTEAFSGCYYSSIAFYDTLNDSCVTMLVNMRNRSELDCTVLSAETGKVRFKHWIGPHGMTWAMLYDFADGWRPGCAFDFSLDDKWYPKMSAKAKAVTALDRLAWPIDLENKIAKKYKAYLKKNAEIAVDFACERDDVERIAALVDIGAIHDGNIEAALKRAKTYRAKNVAKVLRELRDKETPAEKGAAKLKSTLTPTQAVTEARPLIESSNCSFIDILVPVSAKIDEVTKVELLELAAACADKATVEALYGVFGDFEFTSNALALAIMAGSVEIAQLLLKRGASFEEVPSPEVIAAEFDARKKKRYVKYLKFAYEKKRLRSKDSASVTLEKVDYATVQLLYMFDPGYHDQIPCTGEPASMYPQPNNEVVTETVLALVKAGDIDADFASAFGITAYLHDFYEDAERIANAVGGRLHSEHGPIFYSSGDRMKSPSDCVVIDDVERLQCMVNTDSPENIAAVLATIDAEEAEYEFRTSVSVYHTEGYAAVPLWAPYARPDMPALPSMILSAAEYGQLDALKTLLNLEGVATDKVLRECIDIAQENERTEMVAWLLEKLGGGR